MTRSSINYVQINRRKSELPPLVWIKGITEVMKARGNREVRQVSGQNAFDTEVTDLRNIVILIGTLIFFTFT